MDDSTPAGEPPARVKQGKANTADVALVDLSGISKTFGQVVACDSVDLTLRQGKIHGILGENGAGKSTLMKILIGLHGPDAGEIKVRGTLRRFRDPADARKLGIAMVHQHFSLVPALKVWENVVLGDHQKVYLSSFWKAPQRALENALVGFRSNEKRTREQISEISTRYGLDVDSDARVRDLPVGVRQRVEIIKCLRYDPQIMILDEPTSVLSPAESERLFKVLRQVVEDEGRCVALVSHKLNEILAATDELTIMRQGKVVEHLATSEATAPALARAMVGREVSLTLNLADIAGDATKEKATESTAKWDAASRGEARDSTRGKAEVGSEESAALKPAGQSEQPALRIRNATATDKDGSRLLDSLSLEVRRGEIAAVAGVEGNGQTALDHLLSSLLKLDSGSVEVEGYEVPTGVPGAFVKAGVGVISEDRHDMGCIMDMSLCENLYLSNPKEAVSGSGMMSRSAMSKRAAELIDDYRITASGPDAPMWSISGGNQQRVVLARELSHKPKVLLASQPTRGLDVGAVEYFLDQLRKAAEDGIAVLLVSHELEEILELAHRIVVIYNGKIVGELPRQGIDMQRLGMLMGGMADTSEATSDAEASLGAAT